MKRLVFSCGRLHHRGRGDIFEDQMIAPCEGTQDSLELWNPSHGFRIPGTGIRIIYQLNLDSGFQSPGLRIPREKQAAFRFHKQTFPRLRNLNSLTWGKTAMIK